MESGCEVKFDKQGVKVFREKTVIIQGVQDKRGIYILNLKPVNNLQHALAPFSKKEPNWHLRLAHLSDKNVNLLKNISSGINSKIGDHST